MYVQGCLKASLVAPRGSFGIPELLFKTSYGLVKIPYGSAAATATAEALAAEAFATAIRAGQLAADADPMPPRDMAAPSTPLIGKAFLE